MNGLLYSIEKERKLQKGDIGESPVISGYAVLLPIIVLSYAIA
jgi:hypothetical protein